MQADQFDATWDWVGNNIPFHCPEIIHRGERACPNCGKSKGVVRGGRESGGTASDHFA